MNAAEAVSNILAHHGVKGMKWGVRRKATVGPQEVIISDKRKKLKAKGGKDFPASSEAIRAKKIGQVGKKSGLKALSNEELQAYSNRMNLEQGVKRLEYNEASAPVRFVKGLMGDVGKRQATNLANDVAANQVKKHLAKRLAVSAAAAAV
jgi:hypothetical protein